MKAPESLPTPAKQFQMAATIVALIVGVLVLVGWSLQISPIEGIVPGWTPMKSNTAVAFILAGLSLSPKLRAIEGRGQRVADALALACSAIGVATLAEHLLAADFGIDQLFFTGTRSEMFPGRMAINTAFSLGLLGVALTWSGSPARSRRRLAEACAGAIVAVVILALLGYLYSVPALAGQTGSSTAMAVHTALLLLALAGSASLMSADSLLAETLFATGAGSRLARRLVPTVLVVLVFVGWPSLYAVRNGVLEPNTGLAVLCSVGTVMMVTSILVSAQGINQIDSDWLQAQLSLRESEELRRAERVAAANEARYLSLFESMTTGLASCRLLYADGQPRDVLYLAVNPAFERLTGMVGVAGKTTEDIAPGLHAANPELLPLYDRVVSTGMPESLETFVTQLGVWLSMRVYSPGPEQFMVMFDNITERKTQEKLLYDSEARFRAMFEQAAVGIARIARDGRFLEVNERLCEITGRPRANLLAHTLQEITDPDDLALEAQSFEGTLRGELPFYAVEQRYIADGGRSIWTNTTKSLVREADGAPGYLIAIVEDISARKHAEEELQRSHAELERFAYVASHDLQEPLRTISSYVQLLARRYRDRLDSDALEFIDFAVQGTARMQQLINDLLSYSRVGRRAGVIAATDASAVLDAVLESMQASIAEAGAIVTHEPMPNVLVDPSQLGQVFTNLVSNAIKFHRDETPRVHIGAVRDHNTWTFSVRDNGIGIDPQYFDRIFVIFQRLHTQEKYPGTGVGLAIVKKIVERHGGSIWAESRPGVGSTMHFTLPIVPADRPAATVNLAIAETTGVNALKD